AILGGGGPPQRIAPQLSRLVKAPPEGDEWAHETKFDGYRMAARLDRGRITLLTRRGLDWSTKYPLISGSFATLRAETAYLDGELGGIGPDGRTAFNLIQNASDGGNADSLVFFLFDCLYLNGKPLLKEPLLDRKAQLRRLLADAPDCLHFSD